MDNTKKMLRAIMNGQSALKQELLGRIAKLEGKADRGFEDVNKRIDDNTERLDKIGLAVARLEDLPAMLIA